MRRAVTMMVVTAMVVAFGPAAVAADHGDPCGVGEVAALAQAGPKMFDLANESVGPGVDCGFRLYDENDVLVEEIPHEFTTEDVFLGGIFWFFEYGGDSGFSRLEAKPALASIVDRLYFGPVEDYPNLPQVSLTVGPVKGVHLDGTSYAYEHRYAVFSGLEPGFYAWVWEVETFGLPAVFGEGLVEIVEAAP